MKSQKEFLLDIEEVSDGLNEALRKLRDAHRRTETLCVSKVMERRELIDVLVKTYLPNLEAETLRGLENFPLIHRRAISLFDRARGVRVPFFKRISGGGPLYRVTELQREFDLLSVGFRSYIDTEEVIVVFSPVRKLRYEISLLDKDLAVQKEQIQQLENKLAEIHQARANPAHVPHAMRREVNNSVRALRSTKGGGPRTTRTFSQFPNQISSGSDDTDLLILWAFDVPTSLRTVVLDEVIHNHHQTSVDDSADQGFGGGGGFSGGGGGTDFTGPSAPEQTPPVVSDDLLGSYS